MKRKDALWVMQMCRDRDARSEAEREAFDTAIEALKSESIFTADRPRGEWIDMADFEQCSECRGTHLKEVDTYYGKAIWIKTDFCPNCGAKMDRERSEDK